MTDKTILTTVDDCLRSDGNVFIKQLNHGPGHIFSHHDESIMIKFEDVSAYVEYGSEWADFNSKNVSISLCNEQEEKWPHWIFEEFQHIEMEGELRPISDYETIYQLKDNRVIKGADPV